jgi:hypothetical protein
MEISRPVSEPVAMPSALGGHSGSDERARAVRGCFRSGHDRRAMLSRDGMEEQLAA